MQERLPGVNARDPLEIINEAVEAHAVDALYGCFSGGTDSLLATYWASKHRLFRGVVSVDTTIAIPETHDYIRQTCEGMGWDLIMQATPHNWEWLAMNYGMLGPAYHQFAYSYLKERAFRIARKRIQNLGFKRIGFVSGARRAESRRRAKNVTYSRREGSCVWINAIADYFDCDKKDVMRDEGLTQSEVSKRICMSGDCLCGTTFEHEREKRIELRRCYPEAEAKIAYGESIAEAYAKPCHWAHRPPEERKPDGVTEDLPGIDVPLCADCSTVE